MSNVEIQISEETLRDYDLLREECGWVELSGLSLVEMRGEDRKGWLQGQATNDLRKLEPGASSAFCLTSVTGHLISVCEAWALEERLILTCHKSTVPSVLKRVEQMVIMEDVEAFDVSEQYELLSIQGPTATSQLMKLLALPSLDAGSTEFEGATVGCMRSNRTGLGGWDLLIAKESAIALTKLKEAFAKIGPEAYEIARIEAGIPIFGKDMGEKTFPPEMGTAFENRHVSYSKGCYMGQEVLMRIHSRGHTNRTWVGLKSDQPIELGASVDHLQRSESGVVTSVAFSPDFGYIGAAMVRNEAAFEGETVRIRLGGTSIDAEIKMMPFLRLG